MGIRSKNLQKRRRVGVGSGKSAENYPISRIVRLESERTTIWRSIALRKVMKVTVAVRNINKALADKCYGPGKCFEITKTSVSQLELVSHAKEKAK